MCAPNNFNEDQRPGNFRGRGRGRGGFNPSAPAPAPVETPLAAQPDQPATQQSTNAGRRENVKNTFKHKEGTPDLKPKAQSTQSSAEKNDPLIKSVARPWNIRIRRKNWLPAVRIRLFTVFRPSEDIL